MTALPTTLPTTLATSLATTFSTKSPTTLPTKLPTTLPTTDTLRISSDPEWASRGACRDGDPEELFVVGAAQNKAKLICMSCPVRIDCLADALDSRAEFGVWGGMTERERRHLLRRRSDISSWRRYFESGDADDEFETLTQVAPQNVRYLRSRRPRERLR